MPSATRTALGKQGAAVARRKRTGGDSPKTRTELYEMDLNQTCPQCVPIPLAKPTGLAPVTKITTGANGTQDGVMHGQTDALGTALTAAELAATNNVLGN